MHTHFDIREWKIYINGYLQVQVSLEVIISIQCEWLFTDINEITMKIGFDKHNNSDMKYLQWQLLFTMMVWTTLTDHYLMTWYCDGMNDLYSEFDVKLTWNIIWYP